MTVFRTFGHFIIAVFWLILIFSPVYAGVFDNFSGSWRGTGKVVLKNGTTETVKCKIKSVIEVNGTRVYHKVKCKSDSKKINVRINLIANKRSISGKWSASGAVEGSVYGKVKGKTLNLQLSGRGISAVLYLTASNCYQKLSLAGEVGKIRKLSVQLKKSC